MMTKQQLQHLQDNPGGDRKCYQRNFSKTTQILTYLLGRRLDRISCTSQSNELTLQYWNQRSSKTLRKSHQERSKSSQSGLVRQPAMPTTYEGRGIWSITRSHGILKSTWETTKEETQAGVRIETDQIVTGEEMREAHQEIWVDWGHRLHSVLRWALWNQIQPSIVVRSVSEVPSLQSKPDQSPWMISRRKRNQRRRSKDQSRR